MMILYCWFVLFWGVMGCCGSSQKKGPISMRYPNFDVTGRDFANTQTRKLCLLARLNASIVFTHENISKEVFIPSNASNDNSVCDFNYESKLQLDFSGASFILSFRRTPVVTSSDAETSYCNGCDQGNWRLDSISVHINDTSEITRENHHRNAPPTKLVAQINGKAIETAVSAEAGGFTSGVSLLRGYSCTDKSLKASLTIEEIVDIDSNRALKTNNWTIEVRFYAIRVQPFLVTNDIIQNPVLCKDITLIFLIILLPLLYFALFVVVYRLKHRYGFPKCCKTLQAVKQPFKAERKKKLISQTTTEQCHSPILCEQNKTMLVTCTTAEEQKTCIVTTTK